MGRDSPRLVWPPPSCAITPWQKGSPLTHAYCVTDSFGEEVRGALTHLPISLAEGQRVKVSYRKRRNHPTNACQVATS
jgi:hypothetical protein